MNGAFIVFSVIILALYFFVLMLCITPWFGVSIIPYLVIFTFIGAALILGIIWAFNANALNDVGWETFVIIILMLAALLVAIFVIWYFVRKYTKRYAHEVAHKHFGEPKHHHHHQLRDPMSNTPIIEKLPEYKPPPLPPMVPLEDEFGPPTTSFMESKDINYRQRYSDTLKTLNS